MDSEIFSNQVTILCLGLSVPPSLQASIITACQVKTKLVLHPRISVCVLGPLIPSITWVSWGALPGWYRDVTRVTRDFSRGKNCWGGGGRRDPKEMQGHQSRMQAWPLWRSLRKIGRVSGCMYFKGQFVQADEWPWGPPHTLEESHFCILQERAGLAFPVGLYIGLNISFGRCGWDMNVVVESQHSSWVPVNHASCSRRLEEQISIACLLRTVKILHLRTGQSSRKKRRK